MSMRGVPPIFGTFSCETERVGRFVRNEGFPSKNYEKGSKIGVLP
jgi:hypothetical protein